MSLYKTRWKIETLFGALKTRGFNLELTQVTQSKRLENLVLLLGAAVLWALLVGLWVSQPVGIRVRRDGTPFYSLFRVGLDCLRRLLFDSNPDLRVWDDVIHVLSSTWREHFGSVPWDKFRVIIIPASSNVTLAKAGGLNLNDYNAVRKYYILPE